MTNINLHQTADKQGGGKKFFNSGVFVSVLLLIVTLLLYGGLKTYNQNVYVQVIAEKEQQTEKITQTLKGDDVNRVNDFDLRLQELSRDADTAYSVDYLLNTAKVMVEGAVLDEFSFEQSGGMVQLKGTTDTMQAMAKQLFHLKTTKDLKSVTVESLNINDEGRLSFEISAATIQ